MTDEVVEFSNRKVFPIQNPKLALSEAEVSKIQNGVIIIGFF
jgi:hypothetical protein